MRGFFQSQSSDWLIFQLLHAGTRLVLRNESAFTRGLCSAKSIIASTCANHGLAPVHTHACLSSSVQDTALEAVRLHNARETFLRSGLPRPSCEVVVMTWSGTGALAAGGSSLTFRARGLASPGTRRLLAASLSRPVILLGHHRILCFGVCKFCWQAATLGQVL